VSLGSRRGLGAADAGGGECWRVSVRGWLGSRGRV